MKISEPSGLKDHGTDLDAIRPKKRIYYDKVEEFISQDDDFLVSSTSNLKDYYPDKSVEMKELSTINEGHISNVIDKKLKEEENQRMIEELEKQRKEKEEADKKSAQERVDIINNYLKDGPLVYELYSILVHSGGAYGGHYFTFIKSFEDGKWYNFDDSTVREIDANDIPAKTFGGSKSSNAYMLLYRQVEGSQDKLIEINDEDIPDYIRKMYEEENKIYNDNAMKQYEVRSHMNLKVYYKLEVKFIPTTQKETLDDLLTKTIETYGLKEDRKNIRLRAYIPHTDTLSETYTGREKLTLQDLKIFSTKCLSIEIRKDNQEWEEYDLEKIMFKIATWKEDLIDLDEDSLKPIKIFVNKSALLVDLIAVVANELKMPLGELRLIKKVIVHGIQTAEVLSTPDKLEKTLMQGKIFENMLLYTEQFSDEKDPIKWGLEFEKESYRYKIKFNNPYQEAADSSSIEYPHTITVDCRKTLGDLKKKMCEILKIDENQILMKRAGKNGVEVKDIDKSLQGVNFVNGSSIYLEFGVPSLPGEYRLYFSLAIRLVPELDSVSHKFEELFELPISGDLTVSQVKLIVAEKLKNLKNLTLDPKYMRLRERVSERMLKVYRNAPLKTQNIFEKKQIAIETLEYEDKVGPRDSLINVRLWDPENMELSSIIELVIDRNESLVTFAQKIYEKNQEILVCFIFWMIISSYIR